MLVPAIIIETFQENETSRYLLSESLYRKLLQSTDKNPKETTISKFSTFIIVLDYITKATNNSASCLKRLRVYDGN